MKIRYVLCVLLCNLVCCLMAAAHGDCMTNTTMLSGKFAYASQESRTSQEELADMFAQNVRVGDSLWVPMVDCPTTPSPKRRAIDCPTSPDKDCPVTPLDCPTSPIVKSAFKARSSKAVLGTYLNARFYQQHNAFSAR